MWYYRSPQAEQSANNNVLVAYYPFVAKGKGCRPWFQNRTKSMGPFVSFQTRFFLASGKRVPTKMEKNHQILTLNLNEPSHGHNFSVASCRLFEASDFFTNPFPMKR